MTAIKKKILADYVRMLTHLDNEAKVVLIKALTDSMGEKTPKLPALAWKKLYGIWEGEETAEEFVSWLRENRNFSRKEIQL